MERTEFKHMNEIIIRGPIVRKFTNGIACNLTIKTPRLNMPNTAKDGEVAYNYPELAFYGDALKSADAYHEGDVVEIVGMIQPQRKASKDTGNLYFDQKLIGLSIKPAERLLMREFGYDVGTFVESRNLVKLGGVISKIVSPSNGIVRINIRTYVNGRVNNIQTFLYDRNTEKYLDEFKVGDQVFAAGTIQTLKKKVDDGSDKYYRNIVLSAICKAE